MNLRHYIGPAQYSILRNLITGEEGKFFQDMLYHLEQRIAIMPGPMAEEEQPAIAYLHYFGGSYDAWITQKDIDGEPQHQVFGYASFNGPGEGEYGYISLPELFENGIELDLYWEPTPIEEFA